MSLHFYIERVVQGDLSPPVRSAEGEVLVPLGSHIVFRLRLAADGGQTAVLRVPRAPTSRWEPLRMMGSGAGIRSQIVHWASVRTLTMADDSQVFVRLDLPIVDFARAGVVRLSFVCNIEIAPVFARSSATLGAFAATPRQTLRLAANDVFRILPDQEFRRRCPRVRSPVLGGAMPRVEPINYGRTNAPLGVGSENPPGTVQAAQQQLSQARRTMRRAPSSSAFDRYIGASDVASLVRGLNLLEQGLTQQVEDRRRRRWIAQHRPSFGDPRLDHLAVPAWLGNMIVDAASAPPGTWRVFWEGVVELLRWAPLAGEVLDWIEGITGFDVARLELMTPLEQAFSLGSAVVDRLSFLEWVANAVARPLRRYARRGALRLVDMLGEVGERLARASERLRALARSFDTEQRAILRRALNDVENAELPLLLRALDVVAAMREMLASLLAAMARGVDRAVERTGVLRSYVSRFGERLVEREAIEAGGHAVRDVVQLDDGAEVRFFRDADQVSRMAICLR